MPAFFNIYIWKTFLLDYAYIKVGFEFHYILRCVNLYYINENYNVSGLLKLPLPMQSTLNKGFINQWLFLTVCLIFVRIHQ